MTEVALYELLKNSSQYQDRDEDDESPYPVDISGQGIGNWFDYAVMGWDWNAESFFITSYGSGPWEFGNKVHEIISPWHLVAVIKRLFVRDDFNKHFVFSEDVINQLKSDRDDCLHNTYSGDQLDALVQKCKSEDSRWSAESSFDQVDAEYLQACLRSGKLVE